MEKQTCVHVFQACWHQCRPPTLTGTEEWWRTLPESSSQGPTTTTTHIVSQFYNKRDVQMFHTFCHRNGVVNLSVEISHMCLCVLFFSQCRETPSQRETAAAAAASYSTLTMKNKPSIAVLDNSDCNRSHNNSSSMVSHPPTGQFPLSISIIFHSFYIWFSPPHTHTHRTKACRCVLRNISSD